MGALDGMLKLVHKVVLYWSIVSVVYAYYG